MIWTLLIAFQLKHFIADYPLQANQFMLGKFLPWPRFVIPLSVHCAVHAVMTLAITLYVNPSLWWLSLVDFTCHWLMDFVKANSKLMGRWKPLSPAEYMEAATHVIQPDADPGTRRFNKKRLLGNKLFWQALGFDQGVHHLTHYFIIWMLL